MTHVPPELLNAFFDLVRCSLRDGGKLFFVDSKREDAATARDQILPGAGSYVARRKLNDGRTYDIVKLFHDPAPLAARMRAHGLVTSIKETARFFIYGTGEKIPVARGA